MSFKTLCLSAGLPLTASIAFANSHSELPTRTIYGLSGPAQARDISNDVLGDTPLAAEGISELAGRNLRTRFWTIKDRGVVPIHDHANRPAVFTILTGEIFEYTSISEARILHKAGGLALEEGRLAHWWQNEQMEVVHLIAFDVYAPNNAPTTVAPPPVALTAQLPEAQGVESDLLGAVDLDKHFGDGTGAGWVLSTYRATLAPGGILPSFVTPGEPLQAFVWEGAVLEHRGKTSVALGERDGSSVADGAQVWWQNTGDAPAVMYFGVVEPASEVAGVPQIGRTLKKASAD